jgi:putative intracellular protease/amidase
MLHNLCNTADENQLQLPAKRPYERTSQNVPASLLTGPCLFRQEPEETSSLVQDIKDHLIALRQGGKKMKRFIIVLTILVTMAAWVALAYAEPKSKVLLIPREGTSRNLELMLTEEVGVMVGMLEKSGFEVEVATASGEPIASKNVTLKPDLKLLDVKVADYAGFIMACMAVGIIPSPPQPPEAVSIVKQAVAQGKPIAAQFGAVQILAEAGILKGKRYAAGAIYSGRDVVQDGNIITSGVCPYIKQMRGWPDGTAELTQKLIAELKKRKNP